MFDYFYHEILRKTILTFGTVFNDIFVRRGESATSIKVPLRYGPTQKFLAKLEQMGELNKPTSNNLPRMAYDFIGMTYDPSRKITSTSKISVKDPTNNNKVKKVFTPVPYNMQFELAIMSKSNDDALQIIEQILPYFQPSFNISIKLLEEVNETKDIPIVLENITFQDDYEGDFTTRRVLIYTLRFTVKTYLYGPISKSAPIKTATLSYYTETDQSPENTRALAYKVTPRAIKDYDDSVVTVTSEDITISSKIIEVESAANISPETYFEMDGEQIYVKKVTGNKLSVDRGRDNTKVSAHVKGTQLKSITVVDTSLLDFGDDFGFDGNTF